MRLVPLTRLSCLTTVAADMVFLILEGCAAVDRPQSAQPAANLHPRINVGEIALVNEEQHFVLIDLESNLYVPPQGVLLISVSPIGRTAHLKAGAEQKRPFVAADILDGNPAVGDRVER
ncbi:MAG TPA: hypothetical protein VGI60_14295 [Chthoniobacterales bacterium]|jgi:hypothetical protein